MWCNLLVEDMYELGLMMKVFIMVVVIDSGKYNVNVIVLIGEYKIGNNIVFDWNMSGWGNIIYVKGFVFLSNMVMVYLE